MAGNTKDVNLRARLKGSAKVGKGLGRIDKGLKKVAVSAIATVGAFMGARMLYDGMKSVIKAAKEQELQERKLAQVIKSTGGAAGMSAREFQIMASALQKQTRFGDEAIIQAQSLMLTFTKVGKEVMPDAIETVLNMSEAMGQDLRQTTIQVGKALNDPILGVTALRRVGVQLSEQQMQQVDDFMAVGDVAGAQAVILGELETQFGGLAKAAGEGLAGSMDQARNAMGDAAEDIGQLLAPAIIKAADWFSRAAEAASDFLGTFRDNAGLRGVIDDLEELGINADEYRQTLLEIEIAELEATLSSQGLSDSREDAQKVQENLKQGAEDLKQAILDEADAEQKLADAGVNSEEQKRKLALNTGLQIAANAKLPPQYRVLGEATKMLMNVDGKLLEQKEEIMATGIGEVIQKEEIVTKTKEEIDQNKKNLETIAELNKKKKELADTNARIIESEKPDGEDTPKKDTGIELMFLTEAQKTQILKDAAAERKIIQEDELIGEMTREAFQESINLLALNLEQKEAIMKDFDDKKEKRRKKTNRDEIQDNLKTAIINGQTAKEAAVSVIKAEIAEAQASLISKIMEALPFPINLLVAAGAGAMIGKVTDEIFNFPTGGSFITHKKTTLPIGNGVVVGDNASAMERVDITPLPSPNQRSSGNITININAPIVDEYVVDSIIPAIERAQKLNL